MHSLTKIAPGSEITGVPASEIIETIESFFNKPKILEMFFFSLNLWFEINFDFIAYLSNNTLDTLVSSHSM